MGGQRLTENPVHLGLGATAEPQPLLIGMDWYADYAARHASDGAEGRLVSCHDFSESWTSWEMHPAGDELVVCTAGAITLIQERADGTHAMVTLGPGDYVINPSGTWHTADVEGQATALFITAGLGTQHRPR
ncbi:MAG TPA: cupin domain-containing protein [Sphingobium sp.]|uniref:cupin domain-containing protein n=1 Tax=Sphingobium sp. TaxID=1912891 RepID=UPI002ED070CF